MAIHFRVYTYFTVS